MFSKDELKAMKYQEDGLAKNLKEANDKIHEARKATPEHLRDLFTSRIRFAGNGKHAWYWVLK